MQNGGEGLPSQGILVKMLTTLEPHVYLIKFCIPIHFSIIKTHVSNCCGKAYSPFCILVSLLLLPAFVFVLWCGTWCVCF